MIEKLSDFISKAREVAEGEGVQHLIDIIESKINRNCRLQSTAKKKDDDEMISYYSTRNGVLLEVLREIAGD